MINPKHKVAYNYAMALKVQRDSEELLNRALVTLGSDNQIFSLAEPVEAAYTALVLELLGPTLFEWLMWWMYETDYGTQCMEFYVNSREYDPTQMTLYRFLEIVDAP